MRLVAALFVLMLSAGMAEAGLSRAELAAVGVSPPAAGARLDLSLAAPDARGTTRTIGAILQGRPAFLSFVDYTCTTLCGTDLVLLSAAIQHASLNIADYRILVLGIDPKDTAQSADAMEQSQVPAELRAAATFLLPDQDTVARAASALGFHYAYDPANDQFAHPAVVYVIAPDGALRGVLSPFDLTGVDLAKAVAMPSPPSLGLYDRVRLLCYAYDPATGVYSLRINALLKSAAALTIVLLGSAVLILIRIGSKAR
jgi:protein SCO1/2